MAAVTVAAFAAQAGSFKTADVASEAKWVVHLDVDKFLASRIGQLLTDPAANPEMQKKLADFQAIFGCDLLKSIQGITLYGVDADNENAVAVARSTAPQATVEALIRQSATYQGRQYNGRTIHYWTEERHGRPMAAAFQSPTVVVAGGSVDGVKAALDVLDGKRTNMSDGKGLKVPDITDSSFFTAFGERPAADVGIVPEAAVLQSCDWLAMTAGETAGNVELSLKLGSAIAGNNAQIEQVVRGMLAFMTLAKERDPALAEVAAAFKVASDTTGVYVAFSLPADKVNQFLKDRKQAAPQPGGRHMGPGGHRGNQCAPACTNVNAGACGAAAAEDCCPGAAR